MFATLFNNKTKDNNSKVHVYSIGKNKVINNKRNQEMINKVIAKTTNKLNSLGYYKKEL